MKYISIFATILLIWVAVVLVGIFRSTNNIEGSETFILYLMAMSASLILFLVGFTKK